MLGGGGGGALLEGTVRLPWPGGGGAGPRGGGAPLDGGAGADLAGGGGAAKIMRRIMSIPLYILNNSEVKLG